MHYFLPRREGIAGGKHTPLSHALLEFAARGGHIPGEQETVESCADLFTDALAIGLPKCTSEGDALALVNACGHALRHIKLSLLNCPSVRRWFTQKAEATGAERGLPGMGTVAERWILDDMKPAVLLGHLRTQKGGF